MKNPGEKILLFASPTALPSEFSDQLKNCLKLFEYKKDFEDPKIMRLSGPFPESLKEILTPLCSPLKIDFFLIDSDLFNKKKKLIVFDMDSTLIAAEVIDELARVHGIGEKVSHITERAMKGELNFDESLKERVSLLKGLSQDLLIKVYDSIAFTPGTEEFMKMAETRGIKTAIASGGFQFFAEKFKDRLKMDYFFANQLEIENGVLTGKTTGEIINAEKKAQILVELTQKLGLKPDEVVAVGDGANDLLMLGKAGMGVAFHAKEKVQNATKYHINFNDMTLLSYYLDLI